LFCVQTDYNNDGLMDVYIPRGAWLSTRSGPACSATTAAGFHGYHAAAGLMDPVNSISVSWSDYDNDGWLDLSSAASASPTGSITTGERYLEEVSARADLRAEPSALKSARVLAWVDFDNDNLPRLFVNYLVVPPSCITTIANGTSRMPRRRWESMTASRLFVLGVGLRQRRWLDIFATSYDRTFEDVVKGLLGQPHDRHSNRLYHNVSGRSSRT